MTESVSHQFPHPTLTTLQSIEGKPNHASLKLLHKELNANGMSIPSVRGSGQHGHLSLIISNATYLALANLPFQAPVHPGPAPEHTPAATGPQITETNRQYASNLKEFQVYTSVEASLRKQLIAAVPSTFIDELSDDVLGYANTTTLALLNHLDTTYGTISADDLDQNLTDLHRPWSTEQPIEDLWKQLRACLTFAHDIDPISAATAVRAATQNLEKTGVFSDAIKDWRKLPEEQHTIAQLKTHFNRADKERHRTLTTRDGGYAGAATYPATEPNQPRALAPPQGSLDRLHYCWSHGLGPNNRHTSRNCQTKAPGHRDEATATNMLGGCNNIHRRRGEEAIFVPPPPVPRNP
jgi:hypothetical protein